MVAIDETHFDPLYSRRTNRTHLLKLRRHVTQRSSRVNCCNSFAYDLSANNGDRGLVLVTIHARLWVQILCIGHDSDPVEAAVGHVARLSWTDPP